MIPTSSARVVAAGLAVLVLAGAAAPAAAASHDEPSLAVDLRADGSAAVSVTFTYDLTTDAERAAFRTLANDETARSIAAARFRDRLESVAASAENATGREMAVRDASIEARTADNETGIVTLSVVWEGFAAQEDDRLVVGEPLASGFTTDRRVVVRAPDGYAIVEATPEPTATDDGQVAWAAGTEIDGFRVVAAPDGSAATDAGGDAATTAAGGDDTTPAGAPGFGAGIAVLALLAAALFARRR